MPPPWRTDARRANRGLAENQQTFRIMFPLLAAVFFGSTLLLASALAFHAARVLFRIRWMARLWAKWRRGMVLFYAAWFGLYACFILFATGPSASDRYPPTQGSPYKLPWQAGARRFVAQGNRSFVSHRGSHLYAYDFWMPIGTVVLAARGGTVTRVEVNHDGLGALSNYVKVEHPDGTSAMYAHVRKEGALVKHGQSVRQGQPLAYSGMVGQTLYPHLHFVVVGPNEEPVAVTFSEVENGIPLAGHAYISANAAQEPLSP
jgi:murein DD-endopeptidase MepM/ murein hydrolase activator NlpD